MIELIDDILRRTQAGETVAVCTVARTRGSTPQKAGAMMLVLADGKTTGTLGGGCVEAEVRVRALKLMSDRTDQLLNFKLDNDYGWDDGLVCGGTMDIAVQIVSDANGRDWFVVRDSLHAGREALVVISVPDERGTIRKFERVIPPRPTLVIAGAGHVGFSLAKIAEMAGFIVTVIDDRPDYATADRFPTATRIVGEIEAELSRFPIHQHTYVVIVTRGHRHDSEALAAVINSTARYVGLIGSKRKVLTILGDLRKQGVSAENIAKVYSPIGLDIGAITPAEIAISIAAELIAVHRRGEVGLVESLRMDLEQPSKKIAMTKPQKPINDQ